MDKLEKTQNFLESSFKTFNRKYFKNKLEEIPMRWHDKSYSSFMYNIKLYSISPKKILIRNNVKTFEEFRNTLVHEMLHYYVDCHLLNITNDKWYNFLQACAKKGKPSKSDIINLLGEPHGTLWLTQAKKLNSKFKELNIGAYQNDTEYDSSVSKKLHLLLEEEGRKKSYVCLSESRYKELLKSLGSKGETSWYELEVNYDNLTFNLKETKEGTRFKREYVKYLKNNGIISGKLKYLGSK